jgi:hypothetical protein
MSENLAHLVELTSKFTALSIPHPYLRAMKEMPPDLKLVTNLREKPLYSSPRMKPPTPI